MKSCAKILRIVGEADFKSSRGCKKSSSIHKALLNFNRFGGDGRDVKSGGIDRYKKPARKQAENEQGDRQGFSLLQKIVLGFAEDDFSNDV